jgi:hypothetical protein
VIGDGPGRRGGLVIVSGSLVAGAAVAGPGDLYSSGSLYPWWTWVLVLTGAAAGAVLMVAPRLQGVAPAVALVVCAQLAGTGAVAHKHWLPAQGIGGVGSTNIPRAEHVAVLMAVAAGAAALSAAVLLAGSGALGRRWWTRTSWLPLTAAVVIVVVLPLVLAQEIGGPTLTTWGAAGLLYAGPWCVALAAAAWGRRDAAAALVLTVAGSAALAAVGPQMPDVFTSNSDLVFLPVAVVVFVVAALLVLAPRRPVEP